MHILVSPTAQFGAQGEILRCFLKFFFFFFEILINPLKNKEEGQQHKYQSESSN